LLTKGIAVLTIASVSECRCSGSDGDLAAVTWAYALCALIRLPRGVLHLPLWSSAF
jgi:hypothetical protein